MSSKRKLDFLKENTKNYIHMSEIISEFNFNMNKRQKAFREILICTEVIDEAFYKSIKRLKVSK